MSVIGFAERKWLMMAILVALVVNAFGWFQDTFFQFRIYDLVSVKTVLAFGGLWMAHSILKNKL